MKISILTLILFILGVGHGHKSMKNMEKATFGAGCFWGVEDIFMQMEGVHKTTVGYLGGHLENPTYREVCSKTTGHAEVVEIVFDPEVVTYNQLLDVFWKMHNPTTLNRQGLDIGSQYRSAIFYHTKEQESVAINSKNKLDKSERFDNPIVTEITKTSVFYEAEEYHQEYLKKNGLSNCHI